MAANAIFTIEVYRKKNTWYFDDEERGIKKEPFVCGASELITSLLGKKAKKGTIAFSEGHIPQYDEVLTLYEYCYPYIRSGFATVKGKTVPHFVQDTTQSPESGWYTSSEGRKCWLCPAQLAFFEKVAQTIYVKILS